MEEALHKHQVVAGIRAYVQVAFPQLAEDDLSMRGTPEFRCKHFRKVSFCSSLLYVLKRLQKSFPLADYGVTVASVLLAYLREPFLPELLERQYANTVA